MNMQRDLYEGSVQVETAFQKKEVEDLRCSSRVSEMILNKSSHSRDHLSVKDDINMTIIKNRFKNCHLVAK